MREPRRQLDELEFGIVFIVAGDYSREAKEPVLLRAFRGPGERQSCLAMVRAHLLDVLCDSPSVE